MYHEAKTWLILTDCPNSAVKRTAVLAEVAICVPALSRFVDNCSGDISAPPVLFQIDSGERRKIDCSSRVQQGVATGPALVCIPLLSVLKRTREEFETRGVGAFVYLDDISIGMMKVIADALGTVPFLQRELANIVVGI